MTRGVSLQEDDEPAAQSARGKGRGGRGGGESRGRGGKGGGKGGRESAAREAANGTANGNSAAQANGAAPRAAAKAAAADGDAGGGAAAKPRGSGKGKPEARNGDAARGPPPEQHANGRALRCGERTDLSPDWRWRTHMFSCRIPLLAALVCTLCSEYTAQVLHAPPSAPRVVHQARRRGGEQRGAESRVGRRQGQGRARRRRQGTGRTGQRTRRRRRWGGRRGGRAGGAAACVCGRGRRSCGGASAAAAARWRAVEGRPGRREGGRPRRRFPGGRGSRAGPQQCVRAAWARGACARARAQERRRPSRRAAGALDAGAGSCLAPCVCRFQLRWSVCNGVGGSSAPRRPRSGQGLSKLRRNPKSAIARYTSYCTSRDDTNGRSYK